MISTPVSTCLNKPQWQRFHVKKRVEKTVVFVIASVTAIASWAANPTSAESVADQLRADENLTIFVNALEQSSLINILETSERVTVFAPTDSAMRTEGSAFLLEKVLLATSNKTRLQQQPAHHIVLGEHPEIEHAGLLKLDTFANTCLHVARIGQANKIGPESFVTGSVQAINGTIYFVDRLLWSPYDDSNRCDYSLTGNSNALRRQAEAKTWEAR